MITIKGSEIQKKDIKTSESQIKEEVQYSKYNNMKPNNRSTHI